VEKVAVSTDDTGVLRIGMDFESRSNVYYVRAAQGATDEDEKALFERLAFEEGEHYKILQDLRDYLEQTGWWLLWGEGAFMDGF
jgi:rubrerythrin